MRGLRRGYRLGLAFRDEWWEETEEERSLSLSLSLSLALSLRRADLWTKTAVMGNLAQDSERCAETGLLTDEKRKKENKK